MTALQKEELFESKVSNEKKTGCWEVGSFPLGEKNLFSGANS